MPTYDLSVGREERMMRLPQRLMQIGRGRALYHPGAMARHLVDGHWLTITRVARTLAASGELSGPELWRAGYWRVREGRPVTIDLAT